MKIVPFFSLILVILLMSACGGGGSAGHEENDETFENAEEARYAKEGRPFAQAVAKQDFDAAYAMLSSHARSRMTSAEFKAIHLKAHADFFVPLAADKAYVVETDSHILSGEVDPAGDRTDQAIDRISIERYVGDVPDNVPKFIRRAALAAPFYDKDKDDVDARACYLTFLLVEDEGKLKVAHFFYRWHDMLD